MPSQTDYYAEERQLMLDTARRAIAHGQAYGEKLVPELDQYPPSLLTPGACFVTLRIGHQLRGCIGSLEAWRPLIIDIAANAHAAAYQDPRFAPVSEREIALLNIQLSILSKPQPMQFANRSELLAQLRPGIDGLILQENQHRSTYLPSVWEELPDPESFFQHLLVKAGLSPHHWSDNLQAWRYQTIHVE